MKVGNQQRGNSFECFSIQSLQQCSFPGIPYPMRLFEAEQVSKQTGTPRFCFFVLQAAQTHQEELESSLKATFLLATPFTFSSSRGMWLQLTRGKKTVFQFHTKPTWKDQDIRSSRNSIVFLLTAIFIVLCFTGAFLPSSFQSYFVLKNIFESWVSWELVHLLIIPNLEFLVLHLPWFLGF